MYIFKALEGEEVQTDLDYDYFENIAQRQMAQRGAGDNVNA